MKRIVLVFTFLIIASATVLFTERSEAQYSLGLNRDTAILTMTQAPPSLFPIVANPFAAPCRPPGLRIPSVPSPYETACPSKALPYYGVRYGDNPYPLFR